jgi:hypothetical protein
VSYHDHRPALEELEPRDCPAPVTWHGGPVLAAPRVHLAFYGSSWADGGDRQWDTLRLTWDTAALASGPYAGLLAPYGVGPGAVADARILDAPLNGRGWLDDTLIRQSLAPAAAGAGPDDVWAVFVGPGVAVSAGRQNSQNDFAGYHSYLPDGAGGFRPYLVIPRPGPVDGSPWPNASAAGAGLPALDGVTVAVSHEYAEAATDPYGTGWYAGTPYGGEVADLAAEQVWAYDGFAVQGVAGPDGLPRRAVQ